MHLLPLKSKNEFCEIWSIIGAIVDDIEMERRGQMFRFNLPALKRKLCFVLAPWCGEDVKTWILFQEENVPLIAQLLMVCQSIFKAPTADFLTALFKCIAFSIFSFYKLLIMFQINAITWLEHFDLFISAT